jgi:hypothetical protein
VTCKNPSSAAIAVKAEAQSDQQGPDKTAQNLHFPILSTFLVV